MRIFRYRKPSLSTLLGATAAKRSVKRSLGIFPGQGFIEPSRLKQKIKSRADLLRRSRARSARPPRESSARRSDCDGDRARNTEAASSAARCGRASVPIWV